MKYKKSQLYLFAAFILIGIAFMISSARQIELPKKVSAFDSIVSNFRTEAPKAVNYAMEENKNVTEEMIRFSGQFHDYTRTRDQSIGFVYILFAENEILLQNYAGENLVVSGIPDINDNSARIIPRLSNHISAKIGGQNYDFNAQDGIVEIKAVFRSVKGKDVRISVIR